MKIKKITKSQIRSAFLAIKGLDFFFAQDIKRLDWVVAQTPNYHVRLLHEKSTGMWTLELAIKKYFDRWANSTNFVQKLPSEIRGPISIDFNKAITQADKIVKSKAFDWNSYFYHIYLSEGYDYIKE